MKSIVLALIGIIGLTSSTTKGTTIDVAARINPLQCVHVFERTGRLINGCYEVTSFVNRNGAIWALCKLTGILDGVDFEEDIEVPIILRVDPGCTDCCVTVCFGASILRVGVDCCLDMDRVEEPCTPADFPSELLCPIVLACRTIGTPCDHIVMLLNQLLY